MSTGSITASESDSIRRKAEDDLENDAEKEAPPTTDEKQDAPSQGAPEAVSPFHPSQFPDGGKDAWLCLLGTFCCLFCSFGWLNCVGVFQTYYQSHQLSQYSPSTIAWISSVEIFVMFLPGPIVGFLIDNHGPRYILLIGALFHVFGVMMTSLCKEYYQFFLAQAICSPLGLNCIFTAATSSVTSWFLKKRGAAFGIMAAGSGLGGVIFPIMTSHLIPEVGFGWTMRISGFLLLALLIIALFTVKSRLPRRPRKFEPRVFIEPFYDIKFNATAVGCFLFFFGLFVPINYIEVEGLASGMSIRMAGYLIPILNSASIFGRIIPGILADKVGRYNMQVIMSFFAAIIVLAIWLPAHGNAATIVVAALYGFASGGFVSLAPAQIAFISKVEQIGVRTGVLFSTISFAGLASNPVAGAIIDRDNGDFWGLKVFSGVMLTAGAVAFIFSRATVAGFKLSKV